MIWFLWPRSAISREKIYNFTSTLEWECNCMVLVDLEGGDSKNQWTCHIHFILIWSLRLNEFSWIAHLQIWILFMVSQWVSLFQELVQHIVIMNMVNASGSHYLCVCVFLFVWVVRLLSKPHSDRTSKAIAFCQSIPQSSCIWRYAHSIVH